MSNLISRQAAIDALDGEIEITGRTNAEAVKGYVRLVRDRLERLPSAQPYTEAEIQKMQDLEQAEIQKAYECGRASAQPESTRTFVELVVKYPDPELCAYKEYKGKPYYSIKYIENGETYVGYGTYKPEVLSQYLKEYFIPSAQPEWNNHTVACLLAELFDDKCACNYNGIDEWLPEKCEVIDACPNPVGVACWEQYLAWKPCPEPYREDGAE